MEQPGETLTLMAHLSGLLVSVPMVVDLVWRTVVLVVLVVRLLPELVPQAAQGVLIYLTKTAVLAAAVPRGRVVVVKLVEPAELVLFKVALAAVVRRLVRQPQAVHLVLPIADQTGVPLKTARLAARAARLLPAVLIIQVIPVRTARAAVVVQLPTQPPLTLAMVA
jgi:hypothetical protein